MPSAGAIRAVCYCKDCQAYARFLGAPGITDSFGGTEVVASLPRLVHLTGGLEALTCLSLSPRGLLRWYASCCNTPIGNTPRNPRLPYVGLVHTCLEARSPPLETSFGASRMAVNTRSARGKVQSTHLRGAVGVLTLLGSLAGARLTGAYKDNPFFTNGSSTPIRSPRVLSLAERERAYRLDA